MRAALVFIGLLSCMRYAVAQQPWPQGLQMDMPLYIVGNATLSKFPRAFCLDGTRPGFWWRKSSSPNSTNKWRIHIRGGGWCTSLADCAVRAKSDAGSTNPLVTPPFFNGTRNADWGLLGNSTDNPMGDWNAVYTVYCDGSSATSARDDSPIPVGDGASIYLRGFDVLQAWLEELEQLGGLKSKATDVVLTGTSAGGMATYIHADFVRSLLPSTATVVAAPDAGYFILADNVHGQDQWAAQLQAGFTLWNSTRGANQKCLSNMPQELAWRCIAPQDAYAHSTVATFILNSLYDTAQMGIEMALPCNFAAGLCNSTMEAFVDAYAKVLGDNITTACAAFGDRDGYFLTSCAQHEESCMNYDWGGGGEMGIVIEGASPARAFDAWRRRVGGPADWRRRDVAWPGDATCTANGVRHGGC